MVCRPFCFLVGVSPNSHLPSIHNILGAHFTPRLIVAVAIGLVGKALKGDRLELREKGYIF